MNNRPIQKFYYGIVTDPNGFMRYIGHGNSGGYPFLSHIPCIFHDTEFLESQRNTDWVNYNSDCRDGKYKLTIYEVNPSMPIYEAVTVV
jgi:hypothetical protein